MSTTNLLLLGQRPPDHLLDADRLVLALLQDPDDIIFQVDSDAALAINRLTDPKQSVPSFVGFARGEEHEVGLSREILDDRAEGDVVQLGRSGGSG